MSLGSLTLATKSVEVPGGSVSVRGLSAQDVAWLVSRHRETIESLFSQLVDETPGEEPAEEPTPDLEDFAGVAEFLLERAPVLLADAIAAAADDRDNAKIALRLPMPAQIELLEAIGELTFVGEGSVGKFLEVLTRVMGRTTAAVSGLRNSMSGGAASAVKSAS